MRMEPRRKSVNHAVVAEIDNAKTEIISVIGLRGSVIFCMLFWIAAG
jgi:hypothetical protein